MKLTVKLSGMLMGAGLLALACGCATGPDFKGPRPGETWQVSTASLALRAQPDAQSACVKTLAYRDAVTVREDVRVAPPFAGDRELFPESLIPCWVKVDAGGATGYLPVSSLASEWLIQNQNPDEEISGEGMTAAKRGFSESEDDGDMSAMRGAAGAGKAAAKADPAAVAKALKEQVAVGDAECAKFVREGSLSGAAVAPQVLDVPEKGSMSKAGNWLAKAGASTLGTASDMVAAQGGDDAKLVSSAGKAAAGFVYSEVGAVQEFQLGRAVAARVFPAYKAVPASDPRSVYVNTLVHAVAAASNDPTPYRGLVVTLFDSKEVNAFAVPGGFMFVTTGMLEFLKDEDELAAIVGHEMGHLELRHGMTAVGKEKVLKLFSLLKDAGAKRVGGEQDLLVQQLKALVDEVFEKMFTSIRNGYGIKLESQADWRSVQLSARLGYDTRALYDVLERFKATKGRYGGASYPAERGADVLRYREQLGLGDGAAAGRDVRAARYRKILAK